MQLRYLVVFVFLVSCRTVNNSFDLEPLCLQDTVEAIMSNPPRTPRSEIKQGVMNGETFYVYSEQRGTVEFAIILNSDCEYVCEIGGVVGMDNCPENLYWGLKNLELIWLDPR